MTVSTTNKNTSTVRMVKRHGGAYVEKRSSHIAITVVDKEIWRIYPGDTGILKTPLGRTIIIKMSEDKSHAIVEFDREMYGDLKSE